MRTRVFAGLALLAALSPDVQAQYVSGPYGYAEPAQGGYHQPKEDCPPRAWVTTEYLRWWIKDAPQDFPLLTNNVIGPTAANLFGGQDIDFGGLNGIRVGGGLRLDDDGCLALEGSMFLLERAGVTFGAASGATGNPLLVRPITLPSGTQAGIGVSVPGILAGSFHGSTSSELFSSELNLATTIFRCDRSKLDFLAGFRYLSLEERLLAVSSSTSLAGGVIAPLGVASPAGTTVGVLDSFETKNHIYAPQLGARYTWECGVWSLSLLGKVGLGVNDKRVNINGLTTITSPTGTVQAVPGGLLAVGSNSGSYSDRDFVVMPEVGATVGVNVFPWLRITGGYNFLYINKVARPGNQIDPVVNPNLVPFSPTFGQGGVARPSFQMRESDFWAHGLTAGVQLRW